MTQQQNLFVCIFSPTIVFQQSRIQAADQVEIGIKRLLLYLSSFFCSRTYVPVHLLHLNIATPISCCLKRSSVALRLPAEVYRPSQFRTKAISVSRKTFIVNNVLVPMPATSISCISSFSSSSLQFSLDSSCAWKCVLRNDVVVCENDADCDALLTGDGMSGGGGSGGIGGVATSATAVWKVFGMLCYCLLQILVGFGGLGVDGLELGKRKLLICYVP